MGTKSELIRLRVDTKTKDLWVQASGTRGLSEFIRRACDDRAAVVLNESRVREAELRLRFQAEREQRRAAVAGKRSYSPDPR